MDAKTIVSQIRYHAAITGNHALQFLPTGGGKNRILICKHYVKRARAYAVLIKNQNFSNLLAAAAPTFDKAKECFFRVSWWTSNGVANIIQDKSCWCHAPNCPGSTSASVIRATSSFQRYQHFFSTHKLRKKLAAKVYPQHSITLFAFNHKPQHDHK
jgi:hypothetical protein